jgi:hypothetical protein
MRPCRQVLGEYLARPVSAGSRGEAVMLPAIALGEGLERRGEVAPEFVHAAERKPQGDRKIGGRPGIARRQRHLGCLGLRKFARPRSAEDRQGAQPVGRLCSQAAELGDRRAASPKSDLRLRQSEPRLDGGAVEADDPPQGLLGLVPSAERLTDRRKVAPGREQAWLQPDDAPQALPRRRRSAGADVDDRQRIDRPMIVRSRRLRRQIGRPRRFQPAGQIVPAARVEQRIERRRPRGRVGGRRASAIT